MGVMDVAGLTDIGQRRKTNEDQFFIADIHKSIRVHQTSLALDHQTRLFSGSQGKLMAVADGMGGHEAGERASQLVIDSFVDYVLNRLGWFIHGGGISESDFEQQLTSALIACHRKIVQETAAIPQRSGMGSTATLAYIAWPTMFVMHVGDSRCYLLRDGTLQRLTRDHTLAEAVKKGFDAPAESMVEDDSDGEEESPMSHVLWNVIGGNKEDPHPDAMALELKLGDKVLLCTDGLTRHIEARKIKELLGQSLPTNQICQQLVQEANRRGGEDNITVIVSSFREQPATEMEHAEVQLEINDSSSTLDFDNPPVMAKII